MNLKHFLTGLLALFLSAATLAQNPTPNDWRCTNRVGGEWLYGRGPYGCDASAFGPDSFVRNSYAALVFDDAATRDAERRRYMQELYAVLRDASSRYIRNRKPDVSEAERAAFERASFTIAHQESFWSHYRDASDGRLKMMRGDYGHGHGLMQVDDRYHYQAALDGKGWNLLLNYAYSIDEYYAAWQRAPSQSCLAGSANTWRNRARAAYSAYNGGPSKICRWTNPSDTWARNDIGFAEKWDASGYATYVSDKSAAAKVAVGCLMDGGSNCPPPGDPSQAWPGKLLRVSDGAACLFVGGALQCVSQMRDATCLSAIGSFDPAIAVDVPAADASRFTRTSHNRHALCRKAVAGLQSLGSSIALSSDTPLLVSVGGASLGTAPAGTYQVLDFEVQNAATPVRYYRIKAGTQEGFVNGSASTLAAPAGTSLLPTQGDWIQTVVNINLRATPAGTQLGTVPQNTVVQIKELYARDATNELYYLIEWNGQEGWIYSGALLPSSSRTSWTVLTTGSGSKPAHCPDGARYDSHQRLCVDADNVYGPFTQAVVDACTAAGGGAPCTGSVAVTIEGRAYNLPRYALAPGLAWRGNGDCPRGSERSTAHRFHCVEAKPGGIDEVYGPFGTALVNQCLNKAGGGTACYSNRWAGSLYLGLLPK